MFPLDIQAPLIKHSLDSAGLEEHFSSQSKKPPDTVRSQTQSVSWCSVNSRNPEVRMTEQMKPLLVLSTAQPRISISTAPQLDGSVFRTNKL